MEEIITDTLFGDNCTVLTSLLDSELFLKQIIGLHIRNMENYSATINADLLSGALEFVGAINVMHEYRNLLRKGCWTKDEMLTLMKDMLAVDALVR